MPLQLEVFVNGEPKNLIGAFVRLDDGRIAVRASELRELGISAAAEVGPDDLVVLDEMNTLTYAFASDTQTIDFSIVPEGLLLNRIDASNGRGYAPAQTGRGAALNYSLFTSASSNLDSQVIAYNGVSGAFEGRVFGDYGTVWSSAIARDMQELGNGFVRLETAWDYDDSERLLAYRLGDTISGALPWTRPVRMAGLQIQRDFSLRPDIITMPLPSVSGSAVVPSTVDVYVNNAQVYSSDVPAGPFEIANIPVVSAGGQAQVVVRDAAGRESMTTAPIYASSLLLKPGLYEFSAEVGTARHQFGIESNAYSDIPMGAATVRYGWTDTLTLEAHAEVTPSLLNVGLGHVVQLTPWLRASGAASFSTYESELGSQIFAALEFESVAFTGRVSTQRTFGTYTDLGWVTAAAESEEFRPDDVILDLTSIRPPEVLDQVSLGFPLGFSRSQISLNATHLERAGDEPQYIVAAAFSCALINNTTLLATAFKDLASSDHAGAYIGISMPLGQNGSLTSSVSHDRGGMGYGVEYSKPRGLEPGSFGWQARVIEGASPQHLAAGAYRGTYADVQGRVLHYGESVTGTAEVDGAIVASGGGIFMTHRIDDAFAVVDVGAPNVDVFHENRRVATTDSSGRALVTGLRSYETTKISIDPLNLPVDAQLPEAEIKVTPADRNGIAVDFNVEGSARAALVVLRTPDGKFLSAGSAGRLEGKGDEFVVGYDGQAFVSNLSDTNTVVIESGSGTCRATFAYVEETGKQVRIDPVICQ
ncbi:fimbria/pilus outer membrane usher protein [Hyphomicrobium sp. CS1GBMeth3]|uniref:fimbria/pilus outer membrane usher protein n=1 Tax=Hyphomicrobium sp. CS1GBMeth3 TaxID=1892845 RepID=UPI000A8692DA|nr:fimbria/pilus outer membrane usher protein [Hyphomicrobium sp. CS1GBMeth3]